MLNLYSVCGEWKSSEKNQWNFLVDSGKGASLFEIDEDVKFKDLLEMVIEDFGIEDREVRLSYELPLRLKVFIKDSPPVFIRNDRQLRSFINKIKEDPDLIRLCVTVCNKDKLLSHENLCEVENAFSNVNAGSNEEIGVGGNIQGRITQSFDGNSHLDLSQKQLLELENIPSMHQSGTHSRHEDYINQSMCKVGNVFSSLNVGSTEEIRAVGNIQERITQSFCGNSHLDVSHSNKQKQLLEVNNIPAMHLSETHSRHGDHINQPLCEVDQRCTVNDTCLFSPADREDYSNLLHPIPDLPPVPIDHSHSTGVTADIYVKKHFKNKKEMMDRLRKYALEQKFEFKSLWSNKTRVILGCVDDKCTWRLRASIVPHSEFFVVKKFVDQHTCDTTHRNPNHRQATATTLASLICSGYYEKKDGLRPKQIIDLVRITHGVQIKYKKAWRAKELAETLVRGTSEDSPPSTKHSSGRPPKMRKIGVGEFGVPSFKSQRHKCSRCGIGGHNKSTCKNQI